MFPAAPQGFLLLSYLRGGEKILTYEEASSPRIVRVCRALLPCKPPILDHLLLLLFLALHPWLDFPYCSGSSHSLHRTWALALALFLSPQVLFPNLRRKKEKKKFS